MKFKLPDSFNNVRIFKKTDYHDFKPLLTEIEERPPNPLGTLFLWTIIALAVITLLGLYLVKVDIVVTARGKVIPFGDVKVVQPLETGVVMAVHVKEGDYVKKGAVLMEIDPAVDTADLEGKERNLKHSRLAMERIHSVLGERKFAPKNDAPADAMRAQMAQYEAQKRVYETTLQAKEKELREAKSALDTVTDEIRNLKSLLVVTKEDERRQKSLAEIGALAENRYRDKMRERMTLEKDIQVKTGQADQAKAKLERVQDETEQFRNSFREKLLGEYATNLQTKNSLEAEVTSVRFKQSKRYILSPADGYVYLLPVKTVGGVVTTAQPVVGIVPENTPLTINAMVLNKDVGFVREGQRCIIKVDTFEFQKYGTLEGAVDVVYPFNQDEKDRGQDKQADKDVPPDAGNYPVRVKLQSEVLKTKSGTEYRIKPGMTVTTEINVGKRRVIEFFLFPVIRYLDEGLKVR